MKKPTDTNQASEETIGEIFEGLARYNCNAFTKDTLPNEIPPYVAKERVLSLIRTEKLKLLAEVRERVVDEYYIWSNPDGSYSQDPRDNQLIDEQRTALNKLEAEL